MDKDSVIQHLEGLKEMSKASFEEEDDLYKVESIYKDDIEALDTAISILKKQQRIEFKRSTLEKILNEIVDEYFSDDTIENGYGLMDVIEHVIAGYQEEIETLEIA